MTKRLSAVTGEYTDKQGQQKAEWTTVGALIVGKNGKEYVLLDPTVNLAGVLQKQNIIAMKKGEQPSDMVMTSVFDDSQQNNQPQGGYNQPQQGGYAPQNNQPQGGYAPQGGYHNQNNGYGR